MIQNSCFNLLKHANSSNAHSEFFRYYDPDNIFHFFNNSVTSTYSIVCEVIDELSSKLKKLLPHITAIGVISYKVPEYIILIFRFVFLYLIETLSFINTASGT